MKRSISSLVVIVLALVTPVAVFAQDVAPDVLAKKVTDEVIAVLRADKDIQAGNTKKYSTSSKRKSCLTSTSRA